MERLKKKIKQLLRRIRSSAAKIVNSRPVNLSERNNDPQTLEKDVDYAIQIANGYLMHAAKVGGIGSKRILEVGPGINFGTVLILKGYGAAEVMVADRFLAPWNPKYHPLFYRALADRLRKTHPDCDVSPLERVICAHAYLPDTVKCYGTALEKMTQIPDGSVDMIFSNAVLEHLFDHPTAFRELNRISANGACGFHQVDFRDHRDFSHPLEYLLLSPDEFKAMFERQFGECGNQIRPYEMAKLFSASGFDIIDFSPTHWAEDDYLKELSLRLRQSDGSSYKETDPELLKVTSGHYTITKR